MCDRNLEQRIKFLAKSGKTATKSCVMLKNVYGDETMSRARAFEWRKRFLDCREDMHDDPKSSRHNTTKTDENIERVRNLMCSDRFLTIRMMAEMLTVNKESVRKVLTEDLGMREVCAKIAPNVLTQMAIS